MFYSSFRLVRNLSSEGFPTRFTCGNDRHKFESNYDIAHSKAKTMRKKIEKGFALRGVIVAVVLLVLSGCTMAPKYTRPEAPVPSEWPSGPAYKAGTANTGERSAADITWQEFFIDKQLQKLIALALENNRDLRIAALNIERTRALYRIQRAELLPVVNAAGSAIKQRNPADLIGQRRIEDERTIQRQPGHQFMGDRLFRSYSQSERGCVAGISGDGTGPSQHTNQPGGRGCEYLFNIGC